MAFGICIAFHKTIEIIGLCLYYKIQISALEIGIKCVLAMTYFGLENIIVANELNSLFKQSQIQSVFTSFFPCVIVLLIYLNTIN